MAVKGVLEKHEWSEAARIRDRLIREGWTAGAALNKRVMELTAEAERAAERAHG